MSVDRASHAALLGRVASKVADARAHAGKAVTDALRTEADGRPTVRRANRSPSLAAALARLDELLDELAGPRSTSLDGLLRDAREAAYRAAFARWLPRVPERLRARKGPGPAAADLARARGLPLHGRDVRDELEGAVEAAKRWLRSAVVLAGSAGRSERSGVDLLDAWERSARTGLTRAVVLAEGDAEVAMDRLAGRDLVRPEFLDDSPLEGEG